MLQDAADDAVDAGEPAPSGVHFGRVAKRVAVGVPPPQSLLQPC